MNRKPMKSLVYGDFFLYGDELHIFRGQMNRTDGKIWFEFNRLSDDECFFIPIPADTEVTVQEHKKGVLSAWMDPLNGRTCSAATKAAAHPNSDHGKHYVIPLYT